MHDLKSHIRRDFLAICTMPVSVLLAMECVGCSFDWFSIFLLSLKQQQNLIKIVFLYPFSSLAISPQNNEFFKFYTSKLYGFTGMIFIEFNTISALASARIAGLISWLFTWVFVTSRARKSWQPPRLSSWLRRDNDQNQSNISNKEKKNYNFFFSSD